MKWQQETKTIFQNIMAKITKIML